MIPASSHGMCILLNMVAAVCRVVRVGCDVSRSKIKDLPEYTYLLNYFQPDAHHSSVRERGRDNPSTFDLWDDFACSSIPKRSDV